MTHQQRAAKVRDEERGSVQVLVIGLLLIALLFFMAGGPDGLAHPSEIPARLGTSFNSLGGGINSLSHPEANVAGGIKSGLQGVGEGVSGAFGGPRRSFGR